MFYDSPYVYGVKNKDEEIRAASRSGGAFSALSNYVLDKGGVVYGCAMIDPYKASHIRAETYEDRDRMRGSKYIQSDLKDTFNSVKSDLEKSRLVLFSGTSCQVGALRALVGDNQNIIYVDIVCHGVPSQKIWEDYIKWLEQKGDYTCCSADFRDKTKFGWAAHVETLTFKKADGRKFTVSNDIFSRLFYSHNILRPACHLCPYKQIKHPGDITLADFWAIKRIKPEVNDNKGLSLVLINTDLGKEVFESVNEQLEVFSSKIEEAMQTSFIRPFPMPASRELFWKEYASKGFGYIAKRYGTVNGLVKIMKTIKKQLEW